MCVCVCVCVLPILDQCFQKNKPGRIIILYDEDERVASQAATTFVQREVDNVLMLSGGKPGTLSTKKVPNISVAMYCMTM